MEKRYLTLIELAKYIGVAVGTLRNWKIYSPEKLPPHVEIRTDGVNDLWRFDILEVDAWMHGEKTNKEVSA